MTVPSVGFCGSRSATERGLAVAFDIAEQVARHGLNVVSGAQGCRHHCPQDGTLMR